MKLLNEKSEVKSKRVITPHKGGRTRRLPTGLATPETRDHLDEILAVRKISFGDWVKEKVDEEIEWITDYEQAYA